MRLARKIEVDAIRRAFIFDTLCRMEFDVWQAKRAEQWILHGDWRFKGADPSLELSDFTPTEEQFNEVVTKLRSRTRPLAGPQSDFSRDRGPLATPEQVEAFREKINALMDKHGMTRL